MELAIETATRVCSVTFRDDKGEKFEKRSTGRGQHSEKLFVFIEELMKELAFEMKDLDAVMVSAGPGSYTGLRISASAVKGLLFNASTPLFAANTLASFALSAFGENPVLNKDHAVIDARRVHVYHQSFERDEKKMLALKEVTVTPLKELNPIINSGEGLIGTGLKRMDDAILDKAEVFDSTVISANGLLNLYDLMKGNQLEEDQKLIEKVDIGTYDPRYYTSNQVYKAPGESNSK